MCWLQENISWLQEKKGAGSAAAVELGLQAALSKAHLKPPGSQSKPYAAASKRTCAACHVRKEPKCTLAAVELGSQAAFGRATL